MKSPTLIDGSSAAAAVGGVADGAVERAADRAADRAGDLAGPGPAGRPAARSRFAWCVTGSGHGLDESLALAARLPALDLFLSSAAEEVLPIYHHAIEALRPRFAPGFKLFRDKTASAVPVGMLYGDAYHTVVLAPATSNTVAKCVAGISDTLPTNMLAQAGKLGIPALVFACDTQPVVVTRSPHDWVTLRPRRIELANVARLREIEFCQVVCSIDELQAALSARLAELQLAWTTSSS